MLSLVFLDANLDPTIQVGADLKQIDGNYRVGSSDFFIVESCEYVESFLKFDSSFLMSSFMIITFPPHSCEIYQKQTV